MLPAKVTVVALALAIAAWFTLGAYQARQRTAALTLIHQTGTPTPATTARIFGALDDAGTANPDRALDVLRAQALVRADRVPEAEGTLNAVIAAEPQNLDAWLLLRFAAVGRDPALASRADARAHQLDPLLVTRR